MQNDFRETGDVNWDRVMKFLGGGALVGGGIASTLALYKFLSRLGDKRDSASNTSYDDDVMYINLPEKEAHTKEASNPDTALMSYMGMVLAGYLGYKGVTHVFNKVRENQLQTELDQAQNVYLDRLQGGSLGKEASTKEAFSSGDKWGAGMMGVPLIIALMSAVMANKLLSKNRPPLKRQGAKQKIKKLVIRRSKENAPETPFDEEVDMDPTGEDLEGLMRTTMAKESRAIDSGYADLITKVANGGLDEFKDLVREYGFNDSLDMIKGARFEKASELKKSLAVSLVCNDPLLSEPLGLSLASEYHDMGPGICKAASNLEEPLATGIVYVGRQFLKKYAADMYAPIHSVYTEKYGEDSLNEETVKSAIDISDIALLRSLLESDPESEELQEEEGASTLQVSKSKDSTDPDITVEEDPFVEQDDSEEARQFIEEHGDAIDSMLQTG
mgnify:CR=1 FL=1|tara:strand:+ start:294 stop:1625 length:1332 start_codon:yes stop_codon:yes gene_type:complete